MYKTNKKTKQKNKTTKYKFIIYKEIHETKVIDAIESIENSIIDEKLLINWYGIYLI